MFREDIPWLILPVFIALFQVFVVWAKVPRFNNIDTDIEGGYTQPDNLIFDYLEYSAIALFTIQLVFPILDIGRVSPEPFIRIAGNLFVITGLLLSFFSLRTLGSNWSGMTQYRIKKNQVLITNGVYRFIRHPIYLSVILEFLGFELATSSWLFLVIPIIAFFVFYKHIQKEDALLERKFGEEFLAYKRKTKAFIPYLY